MRTSTPKRMSLATTPEDVGPVVESRPVHRHSRLYDRHRLPAPGPPSGTTSQHVHVLDFRHSEPLGRHLPPQTRRSSQTGLDVPWGVSGDIHNLPTPLTSPGPSAPFLTPPVRPSPRGVRSPSPPGRH